MTTQTEAIAVLRTYNGNLKIRTLYSVDDRFAAACVACLPAERFEYPDWCERPVRKLIGHAVRLTIKTAEGSKAYRWRYGNQFYPSVAAANAAAHAADRADRSEARWQARMAGDMDA